MSAAQAAPRRSQANLIAGAVSVAVVLGIGAWVGLVRQERSVTEKATKAAEAMEAELARGKQYLANRPESSAQQKEADETAADVKRRIPVDRLDLPVATFLENKALAAGLECKPPEVKGGIRIKKDTGAEPSPNDRLIFPPVRLSAQAISLECIGRYRDLMRFLKSLTEAPWLIEVPFVEMKRTDRGGHFKAKIDTRYDYQ